MTTKLDRRSFGLLTLATLAISALQVAPARGAAYANPQVLIEPEQLMNIISATSSTGLGLEESGVVLIDVRTPEAYASGHIPGAYRLDPNAVVARHSPIEGALMAPRDIAAILGALGISADRRIVFYDDRGGFHAARMFWLMEYFGHQNVTVLNGGLSAWRTINGPVTRQTPLLASASFHPALSPRRHASAQEVLAHRDRADAVLIDVRPTAVYADGHIPWAVNIPWSQNLGEDSRFLPAEELRAHFEQHGVTPEKSVIMHCQNGLASSHSYVALRLLGFPRIRVYHRSWAEWGSDPALPKVKS